jgi:hypothetical protein
MRPEATFGRTQRFAQVSSTTWLTGGTLVLVLAISFSVALAFGTIVERLATGGTSVSALSADGLGGRPIVQVNAPDNGRTGDVTSPYLPHVVDRWFDEPEGIDAAASARSLSTDGRSLGPVRRAPAE